MVDIKKLYLKTLKLKPLTKTEAVGLLSSNFYDLLYYANKLRQNFKGDKIKLCSIINAKSGKCNENCRFCAQSAHYKTSCDTYPLVSASELKAAFSKSQKNGTKCFGIVTSGKGPTENEVEELCKSIQHGLCDRFENRGERDGGSFDAKTAANGNSIGKDFADKNVPYLLTNSKSYCKIRVQKTGTRKIDLSCSLGIMGIDSLRKLKNCGVTTIHHNLETAKSYFNKICTTHTYAQRVNTIKYAKSLGLKVCSGGIIGIGEKPNQRIELALQLRELNVDSIPINILNPVAGTPLENNKKISPHDSLRTIAIFRFIMPDKDISLCGGREANLQDLQSWIFYAGVNGTMSGGYLTTTGRSVEQDIKMIKDLGLTI
ncbi:MAG: biotin synthase BioB [Endomicrobiales bacterium]|nr:biotin synthase BioB [Endomicrobiales bacterium]